MSGADIDRMIQCAVKTGALSEDEARSIVTRLFGDGLVTRDEAAKLFEVNRDIGADDPAWDAKFREAMTDYVLNGGQPHGFVSDDECDWLIDMADTTAGAAGDTCLDLLLNILSRAAGAPERLGAFVLNAVCERIESEGRVTRFELERLRSAIFAAGGEGSIWVTRREALKLFELNDAIGEANNDPGWKDLFARAVGNHLMARAHPSPQDESEALAREAWLNSKDRGVTGFLADMASSFEAPGWFEKVTYDAAKASAARETARLAALRAASQDGSGEKASWILKRLRWDGKITPAERALVDFLKAEAPGFADGLAAAA